MAISVFLSSLHKKDPVETRSDMYLRYIGNGAKFHHELGCYSTEKVKWVSLETSEGGKPVATRESCERIYE